MENTDSFALNLKVKSRVTILEIPRYRHYKKVAFYTVHVEGRPNDEYIDFRDRMTQKLSDKNELAELLTIIKNIGKNWGYRRAYFKEEIEYKLFNGQIGEINAHRFVMPFKLQSDANSKFGLRLYCIVLSESVVVIVNGDLKTEQKIKDCKNCYPHFVLANKIAQAIDLAIKDDRIALDGFYIEQDHDFELEIERDTQTQNK